MQKTHIKLTLVLVLILGLCLFLFAVRQIDNSDVFDTINNTYSPSSNQSSTLSDNEQNNVESVDTNEVQTANDPKVDVITKNENQTQTDAGLLAIDPIIVFAGVFGVNLEISSYAPVIETGGQCTAIVKHVSSGTTVKETANASPGATTTRCELIQIPTSSLLSGEHEITIEYSSSHSQGTSEVRKVTM